MLALAAMAEGAVTLGDTNLQISGFFSQGWLYSSNNNYPTSNKGGTFDFREMAVNATTTYGDHLRLGAQLFTQSFGAIGRDRLTLDWAVVDYNFSPALGVRLGRVKKPKGLYGDALDLDMIRPTIFLPGAVYSPLLRDWMVAVNGGMLYGSFDLGRSNFEYKVYYGNMPMSNRGGLAEFYGLGVLYDHSQASMHMDSTYGVHLVWNTPVTGLKLVGNYARLNGIVTDGPFLGDPTINARTHIPWVPWTTYSIEYTKGDWLLAAEWEHVRYYLELGSPPDWPMELHNFGWDGWYVELSKRLSPHWTVTGYYGSQYDNVLPLTLPSQYEYDHALCVRYDFNENVVVKLEVRYVRGTAQTFNSDRVPNPPDRIKGDTTVVAAKLTYSF